MFLLSYILLLKCYLEFLHINSWDYPVNFFFDVILVRYDDQKSVSSKEIKQFTQKVKVIAIKKKPSTLTRKKRNAK